jgi:hypothetical protein
LRLAVSAIGGEWRSFAVTSNRVEGHSEQAVRPREDELLQCFQDDLGRPVTYRLGNRPNQVFIVTTFTCRHNGNYKHGQYTEEVAATRRWLREATQMFRDLKKIP